MEENYIIGEVQAVFFESDSNYYKVLLIAIDETDADYDEEEIVVTGHFGQLKDSLKYQFNGQLVTHPKYGLQFKNQAYEQVKPDSKEALVNFLSGPQFKGIGPVSAEKIVETLGPDAVEKIVSDPESLNEVPGLNQAAKDNLAASLKEDQGMDVVILTLNKYGISNQLAYKIYDQYEGDTLNQIQNQPYQLVEDIDQISFSRVDALAEELGIEADADQRMRAGLLQGLKDHCFQSGDTYIGVDQLLDQTIALLEKLRPFIIQEQALIDALAQLIQDGLIIQDDQKRLYINTLFAAEKGITHHIARISDYANEEFTADEIEESIDRVENSLKMTFGASQRQAIADAINSPVFILTGGPGTGKTTVVNGLVAVYADLHDLSLDPHSYKEDFPISLAAPTGRAAKRLGEATSLPSGTIHRLLGLGTDDDFDLDPKYYDNQLNGQLLIIDEMSMVDTWLFNHLLSAVPKQMQVILVGDKDQLPSVGPGQVYSDLIESGTLPVGELTEIYRQEADSSIPFLAADIKNETLTQGFTDNRSDRSFIACSSQQVVNVVSQIAKKSLEKGFQPEDLQVLAPMYKGPAGIDALNTALQDIFNPKGTDRQKEVKHFDTSYRIGDKVLQLTNEPELQIFNGDIGVITGLQLAKDSAKKTDTMTLLFDDIEVEYSRNDFNKITLAYCMSIHKAQGSEFKAVILPFVKSYYKMLRKDLLYTAITRASKFLILCGEPEAFSYSMSQSASQRRTSLIDRLQGYDGSPKVNPKGQNTEKDKPDIGEQEEESLPQDQDKEQSYHLTGELVAKGEISPMIGMEGITPYTM